MNIFAGLKKYAESYKVVDTRVFTADEIAAVKSAKVVSSEHGYSVCFYMVEGGQTYIPVSRDSVVAAGDAVDLTKVKLLTLVKGDSTINRVEF